MGKQRRDRKLLPHLAALFGVLLSLSVAAPAGAQTTTKAPCHSFKQLPDGKWTVVKSINIQHGSTKTTVNAGTVINIGMRVSGVDLYAALQKNCGAANKSAN